MAYRGVLEEVPSFGQTLARNLGKGLSSGLEKSSELLIKSSMDQRKKQADLDKSFNKLGSWVTSELKNRKGKSYSENPEDVNAYISAMKPFMLQGMSEHEAFDMVDSVFSQEKQKEDLLSGYKNDPSHGKGGIENFYKNIKSLPLAGTRAAEAFASPILQLAQQKSPNLSIEELLQNKTPWKREKNFDLPSEKVAESLFEGKTPEEIEKLQESAGVQEIGLGLALPGFVKGLYNKVKPKRIRPPAQLEYKGGATAAAEAPLAEEAALAKEEKPLAGRVSKEVAESPTESRIARTSPETRVYNRLENVKLREAQVKLFPKYESEISQDAAARAAREEARAPKTAMGQASQAARMQVGEKQLPAVRKAYENSIGRVRALEDEVAAVKGAQKEHAKTLLELAQKDLENAEFELIQTLENAKTGSRRVGLDTMTKAAQDKLQKIQSAALAGEDIHLAKMDYSPDMIAEAKRFEKMKKLPARKTDDYYTIVHDTYMKPYKARLGEIDKEIAELSKDKSLRSFYQMQPLGKEKEAINKMIKSAEAENTIHRHKVALREIAQRQKAKERFAKLAPAEGKPKTSSVAEQKMWKGRMQQAKTPEQRAKVIDEVVDSISADRPQIKGKLEQEGKTFKESLEELTDKAKQPKEDFGQIKSKKDAVDAGMSYAKKIHHAVENMLKKVPILGKYPFGREMIKGALTSVIDEINKEYDLDISAGTWTALVIGRASGAGARLLGRQLSRKLFRWFHVENAKKAYKSHDEKKLKEFSPSIKKRAKQELFG